MHQAIERLQPGVRDLPRLSRILQNKHVRRSTPIFNVHERSRQSPSQFFPYPTTHLPLQPLDLDVTYRTRQHYLLLPEPLLATYKAELADSLSPQITALIERAEQVLEREAARREGLKERVSTEQGI